MNPSCAIRTDAIATIVPQPMLSLTIDGFSIPFIIGAMGAWYSATPIASRRVLLSKPKTLPATAAPPTAPQLPDEWYVWYKACRIKPARIATSYPMTSAVRKSVPLG